jgi:hypothetical protein
MPVNPIIAQVAPLDHVAKAVQQEQDSGLMKQFTIQAGAAETLNKASEQVEKSSAGEAGQKVTRRFGGKEKNRQGQTPENFFAGDRAIEEEAADTFAQNPETDPAVDAWTGNIVNVKV